MSEQIHLTLREVLPKQGILHFPPRKANAKDPSRTLRKSKPESSMRLKTSPKLECPYKIPGLRSPLRPASLPPSGLALHSPQASQIHSLPSPAASRPRGCRSVQSAAKPLCTRAAAQPDPARHRGRFVRSVALDVATLAAAENTHVCVICPVEAIRPS